MKETQVNHYKDANSFFFNTRWWNVEEKGKYQGRGGWRKDVLGLVALVLLCFMRTRSVNLYNLSSYLLCANDKRTFVWFLKNLCWELPHWVSEGRAERLNIPSPSQTKKKLANCDWVAIIITLYQALLYLLDSMRAAIGQFSGPKSTEQPAKSKALFLQALFQDKEI